MSTGEGQERVAEPPRADPLAGRLVTTTLAYDGGRDVSAYLPPEPASAVLYAGDGALIAPWGGYLEASGLAGIAIVAVHADAGADEMRRIEEYSPSFDPARFGAHERFVVEDVRAWARETLGLETPVSRTAVIGVSAGAELALALGVRHPELFGAIFAASPGGGDPGTVPPNPPPAYLTSGTLEPWFGENTRRWEGLLREAGGEVVRTEPVGDHGDPFWQAELLRMLRTFLAA